MIRNSIDEDGDINSIIKRSMKKLNGCIASNFKEIRVKKHKPEHDLSRYDRMRLLKGKDDHDSKKELLEVFEAIANKEANNYQNLKDELHKIKTHDGKINSKQLWKMKRKLCPNSREVTLN